MGRFSLAKMPNSTHNQFTSRSQFVSTVADNTPLCREHFRLTLLLDAFPPTEPGQFIQIECRDGDRDYEPLRQWDWSPGERVETEVDELAAPIALLRRPFSLASRRDVAGGVELDVVHRIVGVGTDWMSRLKRGDRVHLLGPLGNRFEMPGIDETAILVGGGVGIPPMLYLAEKLAGKKAVAFCGALSRDLLPLTIRTDAKPPSGEGDVPAPIVDEFARHGIDSVVTTDDGSFGFRGFVTQALERYLDNVAWASRPRESEKEYTGGTPMVRVYTCGPEQMMKRVAEIAATRGIECQVAVERAMACGMGTCQSCYIRVKKPDPNQPPLAGRDWCYRLACTDGPVFRGSDLLW